MRVIFQAACKEDSFAITLPDTVCKEIMKRHKKT